VGGNRVSQARTGLNLIVVFFLCGLWHGAQFEFVVWVLYHGFFLVLERTRFGKIQENFPVTPPSLHDARGDAGRVIFRANLSTRPGIIFTALCAAGPRTGRATTSLLRDG